MGGRHAYQIMDLRCVCVSGGGSGECVRVPTGNGGGGVGVRGERQKSVVTVRSFLSNCTQQFVGLTVFYFPLVYFMHAYAVSYYIL